MSANIIYLSTHPRAVSSPSEAGEAIVLVRMCQHCGILSALDPCRHCRSTAAWYGRPYAISTDTDG
jgi:hypothetical protein